MIEDGAAALIGGIGLLERAVNYTLGSLVLVTPAHLSRRTPCRDWDLAALLAHMNDSLLALHEAAEGYLGIGVPEPVPGDPVETLRDRACCLLGAWAAAEAPGMVSVGGNALSTGVLTGTGAVEVTVHGWDVAQACGAPRPIPRALAAELLDLAPLFVTDADRPGRFDPPLAVPATASAGERLLAFLGRRP